MPKATGRGGRDQAFRLAGWVEREPDRERQHGAERRQLVGDDAVLEVDQRDRNDQQDQHDAERDRRGGVVHKHGTDAQRGRERLHQRVAR
jgi:hypothetical protein